MRAQGGAALVRTLHERCRNCFTCVRDCPASAIRVTDGQAEVVRERCVSCGNCVRVCTRGAKIIVSSIPEVEALLASGRSVVFGLDPAHVAEFVDWPLPRLIGALRRLGFRRILDGAVAAGIVAERYGRLIKGRRGPTVTSLCPAVVAWIERHQPELVGSLAPLVDPMIALARMARREYGSDVAFVYGGPCLAKKAEARSERFAAEVDEVLTFAEIREFFRRRGLDPHRVPDDAFDGGRGGLGGLLALSRGLFQAAGIDDDLLEGRVAVVDGREDTPPALRELAEAGLDVRMLAANACQSCIMGPGMTCRAPSFRRRARVGESVRQALTPMAPRLPGAVHGPGKPLDLSRGFAPDEQCLLVADEEKLRSILRQMGKEGPEDELNCGACGYGSCREHATAVSMGLAEVSMCLPHTIERLKDTAEELARKNESLAEAQKRLHHAEKLASMGQMAAGVAHEVSTPLGVVLMYVNTLLDEGALSPELEADLKTIAAQAGRCRTIVQELLRFARQHRVERHPARGAGLLARALERWPLPPGIELVVEDREDPKRAVEVDGEQVEKALAKLIRNACEAMEGNGRLTLRLEGDEESFHVSVRDEGRGIPAAYRSKIFEPFFSTKEGRQGTGLDLAVSYGIVKMHRGEIWFETNDDPSIAATGTCFHLRFPRCAAKIEAPVTGDLEGKEDHGRGPKVPRVA